MKCEQAAEFVSALCDGETIPPEVAEHVGACETCRARLNAYAAMGAELRRVASLDRPLTLKPGPWAREQKRRFGVNWWKEGKMTMKISKLTFALMLTLILFLSGSLLRVRARSRAGGPVLVLTYRILPNGGNVRCVITTDSNSATNHCSDANSGSWGVFTSNLRFISKDGDRTQLGVRTKYESQFHQPETGNTDDLLRDVPEQTVWIEPGEKQRISVSGLGEIELTGEYLGHMPTLRYSPYETPDPRKDELRVVDPVLIRGNEVVVNLSDAGDSTDTGDPDATLMIYYPGQGRYLFSTIPFVNAVEGVVGTSQVRFNLEGQDYLLLTAIPIIRSEHVWVTHDPQYKLSEHMPGASDSRPMFMVRSLSKLLQPRIQHSM